MILKTLKLSWFWAAWSTSWIRSCKLCFFLRSLINLWCFRLSKWNWVKWYQALYKFSNVGLVMAKRILRWYHFDSIKSVFVVGPFCGAVFGKKCWKLGMSALCKSLMYIWSVCVVFVKVSRCCWTACCIRVQVSCCSLQAVLHCSLCLYVQVWCPAVLVKMYGIFFTVQIMGKCMAPLLGWKSALGW